MLVGAAGARAYVIGPTAKSALLATANKFVAHEVHAWNQPNASYTLGTCRLLHRRPWVAYTCGFELHGIPGECRGVVTVGVKRLADGEYRAQEIISKNLTQGPC
jgi:hypothetical protein